MVYMIMKISSARSVRRGRNQILYGSNEEIDIDETPAPKEVKQEVKEPVKPVETVKIPQVEQIPATPRRVAPTNIEPLEDEDFDDDDDGDDDFPIFLQNKNF